MGGFSEAVQWWEEWQLRVLVLASLFLQYFLFFAGILRKRCIPSWLRFFIWLAYLSSDAVAVYGLATLFNRPKKQEWMSAHHNSARLQVLWAPVLLIHLGGQSGITAYNIEDNELWRRHVLAAVSQVAVAVYVFRKLWPHDRRILAAGVLLFVVGFLKCVLKPRDLKRVSINSLVDSSSSESVRCLDSSQENYVQDATRYFQEVQEPILVSRKLPAAAPEGDEAWKPYDLFVDLTPHRLFRLSCLMALVHDPADKAHRLVRYGLSVTFERLYTKEPVRLQTQINSRDMCFGFRRLLPDSIDKYVGWIAQVQFFLTAVAMAGSSLMITQASITEANHTDASVTNILILLTGVLEFILPTATFVMSIRRTGPIDKVNNARWPDEVAQYNLIEYLARNKKHKKLRRLLATMLVCTKNYIDQLWCMKPSKSSRDITRLVHGYISKGWTERHIKDLPTYKAFNDNRGQWTLKREGCGDSLGWSLERPFDESVLLWHLATDFCFHLTAAAPSDETAKRCRVMSNYMVYLLFVHPEMLMTGARRFLFREAYRQLKETLKLKPQQPDPDDAAGPSLHESELARKIFHNIQHNSDQDDNATVVHDSDQEDDATVASSSPAVQSSRKLTYVYNAWRLAQHLINNLGMNQDDANMWNVIQGVWVEMLCFSAGRCRGYLHAKSLGNGGEYLSYIWLLMSYMGMETLAELMQTTKLKEEDAGNNAGSSNGTTTATASSSSIATRGSGNGTPAAIPVLAASGGRIDDTTEASTPFTEVADADGIIPASPVTTTDPEGDGTTAASPVTPIGDDNV